MYQIKKDMVDKIKDGRTNVYLSEQLGITPTYIGNILKGYKCTSLMAKSFISIREQIAINDERMGNFLNYYFNEI